MHRWIRSEMGRYIVWILRLGRDAVHSLRPVRSKVVVNLGVRRAPSWTQLRRRDTNAECGLCMMLSMGVGWLYVGIGRVSSSIPNGQADSCRGSCLLRACFLTREERVVVKLGADRAPSLTQLVDATPMRCPIHAWCSPWNFTLNELHKAGSAAAISLPNGYRWTNLTYPNLKSAWIASHIAHSAQVSLLRSWVKLCYGNLAPLGI